MTEQEAMNKAANEVSALGSAQFEQGWNAALAWLRSQTKPVAWLFDGRKPGQHRQFASVDSSDSQTWPIDDGIIWEKYPLCLAPQPAIPDGYGETDFGFTFAGISLTEGDKRLMSMLIAALGTDHPAISDITSLLFAARTFAPAILGDWRPVETAPKDGTRIIVGGKSPNGNAAYDAVGQAYWRREVKYAEDSPRCDEPEGFYWASDNTRNGQCPFYITHWMPLPAAPEPSK